MPPFRLVALAATSLSVLTLAPTAAGAAPAERHCVVDVVGQEPDGELLLSPQRCYRSLDQAQADAATPPGASASGAAVALAGTNGTLSTHYDGFGYSGASISVSGWVCSGGYVNLSTTWRNRISSSRNYCPTTRFYDGLNLGGTFETQNWSGNLGSHNNRADSIQYS